MARKIYIAVPILLILFGSIVWINARHSKTIPALFRICSVKNGLEFRSCMLEKIGGMKSLSVSDSMRELEKLQQNVSPNSGQVVYCHDIAAAIGKAGSSAGRAMLSECTSLCASGCFQGALEGIQERMKMPVESLPDMCSTRECIHGFGHVLARAYSANEKVSWEVCARLTTGDDMECADAVFMQLYDPSPAEIITRPQNNKIAWCEVMPLKFRSICYTRLGILEFLDTHEIVGSAAMCARIPAGDREECYILLGKSYSYGFEDNELRMKKVGEYCHTYNKSDSDCINKIRQ